MKYHEIISEAPKTPAAKFHSTIYSSEQKLMDQVKITWGPHAIIKRLQSGETTKFMYKYYIKGTNIVVGRCTKTEFFLAVNPEAAQAPEPTKAPEKAKAPKKAPGAKPAPRKATAEDVCQMIFDAMTSHSYGYMRRPPQKHDDYWMAEIRNWGQWQLPDSMRYEYEDGEEVEDDGDYDWEELTQEWANKLTAITKKYKDHFTNLDILVREEEKNWISITVRDK